MLIKSSTLFVVGSVILILSVITAAVFYVSHYFLSSKLKKKLTEEYGAKRGR